MTHLPHPVTHRDPLLITSILSDLRDAEQPPRWATVVDEYTTTDTAWKTVEGTLYDLISFGAIHRIGKPAASRRRLDTRALKLTPLGALWLREGCPTITTGGIIRP